MEKRLFDMSVEFDGVEELLRSLDQATEDVLEAARRGVLLATVNAKADAQRLAPLDEGNLSGNAFEELTRDAPKTEPEGRFIFPDRYALRMHEDDYNPGPGTRSKPGVDGIPAGRKYAENALKLNARKTLGFIGKEVRDVLESGGP